jgi:hypothetical protein
MVKSKGSKNLNPADIERKAARKREIKKNAENRKLNRNLAQLRSEPQKLEEELKSFGLYTWILHVDVDHADSRTV